MIEKTIKSQSIEYTIYGTIEEFSPYKLFISDMQSLKKEDRVTILLNSGGGRVDVGMMLIQAIQDCQAYVKIIVKHPCYSMGALIALSGDELEMKDNTFLMFHDYSGISFGKGNEQFSKCEAFNKVFNSIFRKISKPFLTEAECKKVLKGQDLYIHNDEDIDRRLFRHFC